MCNTTNSQVYKGYKEEIAIARTAVDQTKSQLVMYNGKVAAVFYFSSDGGFTEDVKNVWGSEFPYLKSVEDKYETDSTWNYSWNIAHPHRFKN